MAAHMSYEDQKKLVLKGLKILGFITLIEVLIALTAKGHLIPGLVFTGFLHYIYMLVMVGFSLYKAYFIVYFFMHMAHEVRALRWTVLLPTMLLIWAIIAFFNEGSAWKLNREKIREKDKEEVKAPAHGSLDYDKETAKFLI
ncbi:MAG: cytochrome C oxidase subunit IV family protein [Saprospiraceae bacterium]